MLRTEVGNGCVIGEDRRPGPLNSRVRVNDREQKSTGKSRLQQSDWEDSQN